MKRLYTVGLAVTCGTIVYVASPASSAAQLPHDAPSQMPGTVSQMNMNTPLMVMPTFPSPIVTPSATETEVVKSMVEATTP